MKQIPFSHCLVGIEVRFPVAVRLNVFYFLADGVKDKRDLIDCEFFRGAEGVIGSFAFEKSIQNFLGYCVYMIYFCEVTICTLLPFKIALLSPMLMKSSNFLQSICVTQIRMSNVELDFVS